MRRLTLAVALILAAGCGSDEQSVDGALATTWIETDWSEPGSYAGASGVEPVASPGELVLSSDPHDMVLFENPGEPEGWWPRSFYPIAAYAGKLLAGYGGPPEGDVEGPDPHPGHEFAEIRTYDPATGQPMSIAYTVDEQGIVILKARAGYLWSPGVDAIESWAFGNLYRFDGTTWVKLRTIPNAIHVYDVEVLENRVYVSIADDSWHAQVWVSADWGQTWQLSLSISSNGAAPRMYALGVFGNNLFAQPRSLSPWADTIFMLDGASWIATPAPGMPVQYTGESMGRFAELGGRFYFHGQNRLYRFDSATRRWDPLHCPVDFSGGWPNAFTSISGYLYLASGYEAGEPRFFRSANPAGAESWELVDTGFGLPLRPYGEKVRDFTLFRGRLYLCTANPYTDSEGGAIYVAGAVPGGWLMSNPHDFGGGVVSGSLAWEGVLEGGPLAAGVRFQVRSAKGAAALEQAIFVGPDGTPGSYYRGGESLSSAHKGHRWFQWRVELRSDDPRYTPSVSEVRVTAQLEVPADVSQ